MYQVGLDMLVKRWSVSLPCNDMEHPNEMTNLRFVEEGNIFLHFDRV